MKFSGKIEDGTSNEPLNFGSVALAEVCALRVHSPSEGLRSPSASSYPPEKNFSKHIVFSRVCDFLFIFLFWMFVCGHDNS